MSTKPLSARPYAEVNYMYLQSAAIDHQFNYAASLRDASKPATCYTTCDQMLHSFEAWFTFKEEPTGTPRILEYQHDSHELVIQRSFGSVLMHTA